MDDNDTMHAWKPGDAVQTPLGKGVVRAVRNNGEAVVEIKGRAVVLPGTSLSHLSGPRQRAGRIRTSAPVAPVSPGNTREVDLHGLTVEQAMAVVDAELDRALRGEVTTLRLIHGRSGGRIRSALHARLGELPVATQFRIDPENPGVTIVSL